MYNIVDAIYQMVVSASWTMMIICYAFASNSDDHDNDGIMMMVVAAFTWVMAMMKLLMLRMP